MGKLTDLHICPDCRQPLAADAVCERCNIQLVGQSAVKLSQALQHAESLVVAMQLDYQQAELSAGRPPATPAPATPSAQGRASGNLIDAQVCPQCRTPLTPDVRCPHCLFRLQGPRAAELWQTMQAAEAQLASLRAERAAAPTPQPSNSGPALPSIPRPAPAETEFRSTRTIPVLLLGLGALLVLVAALIFIAVSWDTMGIGGRSLVLTGITSAMAAGAIALTLHKLRWAAEAFWVVVAGMLVLDVHGARVALFPGSHAADVVSGALIAALLTALGVAVGMWAKTTRTAKVYAVQVCAAVGFLHGVFWAVSGANDGAYVFALAVPAAGLVAWLTNSRLQVMSYVYAAIAVLSWLILIGFAFDAISTFGFLGDGTPQGWWTSLEWWPMALAAVYAAVPTALKQLPQWARFGCAGISLLTASLLVVIDPSPGTEVQQRIAAGMVMLALAGLVAFGHRVWRYAATVAGTIWAGVVGLSAGVLGFAAANNVLFGTNRYTDFSDAPGSNHAWSITFAYLAAAVLIVTLPRAIPEKYRTMVSSGSWPLAVAVSAVGVLVWLSDSLAPSWLFSLTGFTATCAVIALGLTIADKGLALMTAPVAGSYLFAVTIVGISEFTVQQALFLTGLVLVLAAGAVASHRLEASEKFVGCSALGAALGGLAVIRWMDVAHLPDQWFGPLIAAFVVALVAAGALIRNRILQAILECLTLPFALLALVYGGNWKHVALTLALLGASLVLGALLDKTREVFAWLAIMPLFASTVLRYNDGSTLAEVYALPVAALLLGAGIWRMQQNETISSWRALGAGLAMAFLAPFLHALADPMSWRGAIVFAAALTVLLYGAIRRQSAPLWVGALILALMTIRYIGPWADGIPRWVGIGIVGLLLLGLGVVWEFGQENVRRAKRFITEMR